MANKTIYGCYYHATGLVTWLGVDCNETNVDGRLVTDGVHAGQIKVQFHCDDDAYYACYNKTTGKFQLVIPEEGVSPTTLYVTFSNCTTRNNGDCVYVDPPGYSFRCLGEWASKVNGKHLLVQGINCRYSKSVTCGSPDCHQRCYYYTNPPCLGQIWQEWYNTPYITARTYTDKATIRVEHASVGSYAYQCFYGEIIYAEGEKCFNTSQYAYNVNTNEYSCLTHSTGKAQFSFS